MIGGKGRRIGALHHGDGELLACGHIADGAVAASVGAIKTHHTPARVDHMVGEVDAGAFAHIHTPAAIGA